MSPQVSNAASAARRPGRRPRPRTAAAAAYTSPVAGFDQVVGRAVGGVDGLAVHDVAESQVGHGGVSPASVRRWLLEQAFAAYTSGSAYVNHLDDTGLLAPGLLADLAVLDRDPFAGEPAAIGEARVVATYVDGRPVHTGDAETSVGMPQ